MTAQQKTWELQDRLAGAGIGITYDDAHILRRAALTLQRWSEKEFGYKNGCIERDDETNAPYWLSRTGSRTKIADLETGALKRISEVCERNGVYFYHQTDPRGAPLYVSKEPLTEINYSKGVVIY